MSSFSDSSSHLTAHGCSPTSDQPYSQLPSISFFPRSPNQSSFFSSTTETPINSPLTWSYTPFGDVSYPMDALTLTYTSLVHGVQAAAQCIPKPVKIDLDLVSHPQFQLAPSPKKICSCAPSSGNGDDGVVSLSRTSSRSHSASITPAAKKPKTEAQRVKARAYAKAWRDKRYAKLVGITDAPVERIEKMAETALEMFKV